MWTTVEYKMSESVGLSLLAILNIIALIAIRCDWMRINRLEKRIQQLEQPPARELLVGVGGEGRMTEQLIEVTMTYQREDGSRYRRTINDDEAVKWKKMTDGVCLLAQVRGGGPNWCSVNWTTEELNLPTTNQVG